MRFLLEQNPNLSEQVRRQNLDNDSAFEEYISDLHLRGLSEKYIRDVSELLCRFKNFVLDNPPTPSLAKQFLRQYTSRLKPASYRRYYSIVQGFMAWRGTPLDFRPKHHETVPPYIPEWKIAKLFKAARRKKTHKKISFRDCCLIDFATYSGLRRAEMANLKVKDIDFKNCLVQVVGKGNKTRTVDLPPMRLKELKKLCKDKKPDDSVFDLSARSITDKIYQISKRAGVDLHTHSLRHYYAKTCVEQKMSITDLKEFLGHTRLDTTQKYISVTGIDKREAVKVLNRKGIKWSSLGLMLNLNSGKQNLALGI